MGLFKWGWKSKCQLWKIAFWSVKRTVIVSILEISNMRNFCEKYLQRNMPLALRILLNVRICLSIQNSTWVCFMVIRPHVKLHRMLQFLVFKLLKVTFHLYIFRILVSKYWIPNDHGNTHNFLLKYLQINKPVQEFLQTNMPLENLWVEGVELYGRANVLRIRVAQNKQHSGV